MARPRTAIYISSSLSNWQEKLERKLGLPLWRWYYPFGKGVFFGLYHPGDYLRFMWHRGRRTVFWCGSDILHLKERPTWQRILVRYTARHLCENQVEQQALYAMGICASINPAFFDVDDVALCFTPSYSTHVYLCAHPGSEEAYGVHFIEGVAQLVPSVVFHIYGITGENTMNVVYHGKVSPVQFAEEITQYQAGLRLNRFDGFSEVLARSVLMGQYPISAIPYEHIDSFSSTKEFTTLLCQLKYKTIPNTAAAHWWRERLNKSLQEILA